MKTFLIKRKQKGFTLIELLIVITIIATLAVAVFVALNPAKRIVDAKDARRTSDVQTILTAIHTSIVDNKGTYPEYMPVVGTVRQLGGGTSGCSLSGSGNCSVTEAVCSNLLAGAPNLSAYLKSLPVDPTGGTTYTASKSGYTVVRDTNGIVTITACGAEGGSTIAASR